MKISIIAVAGLLVFPLAGNSANGVTDAQIASIVVTANQVDIDAGKLAKSRSTNGDVKTFAELMVTDHTGVNKSAVDLAGKLKVTPQDNPTSQSLKAGGDKNIAHLKTLSGAAFDKAYVDQEVAYHQQVIDALDKTLIPGATNEELKALLIKSGRFCRTPRAREALAVVTRERPLTMAGGDSYCRTVSGFVQHNSRRGPARSETHTVAMEAWSSNRSAYRRTRRHGRLG